MFTTQISGTRGRGLGKPQEHQPVPTKAKCRNNSQETNSQSRVVKSHGQVESF